MPTQEEEDVIRQKGDLPGPKWEPLPPVTKVWHASRTVPALKQGCFTLIHFPRVMIQRPNFCSV